jgi:hypothetical protein
MSTPFPSATSKRPCTSTTGGLPEGWVRGRPAQGTMSNPGSRRSIRGAASSSEKMRETQECMRGPTPFTKVAPTQRLRSSASRLLSADARVVRLLGLRPLERGQRRTQMAIDRADTALRRRPIFVDSQDPQAATRSLVPDVCGLRIITFHASTMPWRAIHQIAFDGSSLADEVWLPAQTAQRSPSVQSDRPASAKA